MTARRLLAAAFALRAALGVAAEGLGAPALVPARRAPGDLVEASFDFDATALAFDPALAVLPRPIRGERYDVVGVRAEIRGRAGRLVVTLQAWASGSIVTKPIQAGPIIVPAFAFEVERASSVHGDAAPAFRQPLALKGTTFELLKLVGAFVAVALGGGAFGLRNTPFARALVARLRLAAARREYRASLRKVARLRRTDDRKAWDEFARGARRYLAALTGLPVPAMTPRELASVAGDGSRPLSGAAGALADADAARFGGGGPSLDAALAAIRDTVASFETEGVHVLR